MSLEKQISGDDLEKISCYVPLWRNYRNISEFVTPQMKCVTSNWLLQPKTSCFLDVREHLNYGFRYHNIERVVLQNVANIRCNASGRK